MARFFLHFHALSFELNFFSTGGSEVHLAQIPDFEMEYLENHLAH